MSVQQKVLLVSFSTIVVLTTIVVILLFTGGYTSPTDRVDTIAWEPRTIEDIYADFGNIETNLDDYIWPTDITRTLTSAFGEYRSTHFHAGIDISTLGRIGAPLFAARDGYIEQVGVSPFGYGKYIVMRHEDGFRTLYAHLDRFDGPIENRVHAHQYEHERYSVTLTFEPDEFVYRQGDIIARSGSTGSGPPHIHFEIRDTNNNPVNPKYVREISINDTAPPIFNRIAAIPLSADAFINDGLKPVVRSAVAVRPGEYVVRNPIRTAGMFGLAADVHDRNDDTWYRHGIYAMDFFFDDSLLYSVRYDRLPLSHRQQIKIHYDEYLMRQGRGRYQKLFIEEGNVLPIYDRLPHGSGRINAAHYESGSYEYRIVAYDFAGNRSTLSGTVLVEDPPEHETVSEIPQFENLVRIPFEIGGISLDYELYRDKILLTINCAKPDDRQGILFARNGVSLYTIPLTASGSDRLQGRLQLIPAENTSWDVYYAIGDTAYVSTLQIYSIHPGQSGTYRTDDNRLRFSFDYGAVYAPVYFLLSEEDSNGNRSYRIEASASILDGGIVIGMTIPDTLKPFDRAVIFGRDGSKWNALGAARDSDARTLTGTIRHLPRNIMVAVDTTQPVISDVLVDGNRNMRLRFRISDDESGIDHSTLRIRLDETLLIGRYDPDLAMVIYTAHEPKQPDTYALHIQVSDRAGNTARYERSVTIR
jgi:murein DD-endopeptidase MepM/ murein hydrolase activator NlpD